MWKRFRSFYRVLAGRRCFENAMADELQFHIEQYAADLVKSGVPEAEASRLARLEFGVLNNVTEDCRQARGLRLIDELGREIRYAVRVLRKAPAFTATALLTLGICLGAHLTIFAAIDSILLRPLPFHNASQLVTLFNTYPKADVPRDGSSITNYYERRGQIPAFSSLAIYRSGNAIVGGANSTERLQITHVSPEFFSTLGVGPVLGRAFKESEATFGSDNVAILTDTFWRQRFQSDPHVSGRLMQVNGQSKLIVGVLPASFRFLSSDAGLYLPFASRPEDREPLQRHSGGNVTQMIARLKPGATLAQAQAQIDSQNNRLEAGTPQSKSMADAGFRTLVVPLHGDHVAEVRPVLVLLEGGVLLLLLIGSVNLTNLLLIRASSRVKELAVRQALGATRANVVSDVAIEITLLTVSGTVLGLLIGAGGIRLLNVLGVDRLPLGAHIVFDLRLAAIAMLVTLVTGIGLSIPVAWFNLQQRLAVSLQSQSRGGTISRAAQTIRHTFVVAQISLAFILLVGSGLLGLSFKRAMAISPGFRADHVLTAQVSLVGSRYPTPLTGLAFTERLGAALGREPGVISAGVVSNLPFSGHSGKSAATVEGYVIRPGQSPQGHYSYVVGGNYFQAMGFSLRKGRFLTADDSRRRDRVCVVDEDFARRYWPQGNPIGHRLFQGSGPKDDSEAFTVIGVVQGAKQAALTDDTAQGAVYYPYIYSPFSDIYVAVRATRSPESLGSTLQHVVRQIDPELSANDLRSMDARIDDSLVVRRSPALLAGLFSGIALLLTGIGTYGVLSYAVAQRHREIGLRMALGAQPAQIRGQFLSLALELLGSGMAVGVVGAWAAGKSMQTVLFHVQAFDFFVMGGATAVIAVLCLIACLLPAQRASRISPMHALSEQ